MMLTVSLSLIILLLLINNVVSFKSNNIMKRISIIKTNTNIISNNNIEYQVNK